MKQFQTAARLSWLPLLLVLFTLGVTVPLSSCGGGGSTTTTQDPPTQDPPAITLTLPSSAVVGETLTLPAAAVVATTPAGLRGANAFLVEISAPGYSFVQSFDAVTAGCSPGVSSCTSGPVTLTIGPNAFPGTYTLTITVFDQDNRSASDSATATLVSE